MTKLLLLEDDPNLSKTLIKYLGFHHHLVDWAKNGEEAIELSYQNNYDLYLFDINVPLLLGTDLLAQLREAGDKTPTIIISALVDIESVTKGFMAGADDYLKKPFDPEELLVRVQAKTASLKQRLKFKDFEVDIHTKEIFLKQERLYLSHTLTALLIEFIQHYPNPVSKESLLLCLESDSEGALRVQINKLKNMLKIEIKNIRGVGYKIL